MTDVDGRTRSEEVARETFDSTEPASGALVDTYPVHTAADVQAAVVRARAAGEWWRTLGFDGRAEILARWRRILVRRAGELAELMHVENGKPHSDAMLEIVLVVDHLAWAARHARRVLRPRQVAPGLLLFNQSATVGYVPYGVVGVIGPWNYPAFTPMGSIAYALAAGNTVVFKPSEYTPGVGRWLADTLTEVAGRPILELVTGLGPTGEALCRSGVDKLAFTGSTATGKKVMATCAETLTPVVIECGGKDALLVDADANVTAAADAAVWGALSNAGQTCVGVERAYVHESVYDTFVAAVVAGAKSVTAAPDGQLGPITMPSQLSIIREHIDDALSRGGRALVGGKTSVGERYAQPTILVDVPEDSTAVTEETFGPTLTITRVSTMDEAVALTNNSRYGLGATVFSRARGLELARRLRTGMVSVNTVISFSGIPTLPFGGVGDSGFGRVHGADGLREFSRPKSIARQLFPIPVRTTTFRRRKVDDRVLAGLTHVLHGRGRR